jgi:hypothetical protein
MGLFWEPSDTDPKMIKTINDTHGVPGKARYQSNATNTLLLTVSYFFGPSHGQEASTTSVSGSIEDSCTGDVWLWRCYCISKDDPSNPGTVPGDVRRTGGRMNIREGQTINIRFNQHTFVADPEVVDVVFTFEETGGWVTLASTSSYVVRAICRRANDDEINLPAYHGHFDVSSEFVSYNGMNPNIPDFDDTGLVDDVDNISYHQSQAPNETYNAWPFSAVRWVFDVVPSTAQAGVGFTIRAHLENALGGALPESGFVEADYDFVFGTGQECLHLPGWLTLNPLASNAPISSDIPTRVGAWTYEWTNVKIYPAGITRIYLQVNGCYTKSDPITVAHGTATYTRLLTNLRSRDEIVGSYLRRHNTVQHSDHRLNNGSHILNYPSDIGAVQPSEHFQFFGGIRAEVIDNPGRNFYNRCTSYTGDLTLEVLGTGSISPAAVQGEVTKAATSGYVEFTRAKSRYLGFDHNLQVTGSGLTPMSQPSESQTNPEVLVTFNEQPTSAVKKGEFFTVKVQLSDVDLNRITETLSPKDPVYFFGVGTGNQLSNEFQEYTLDGDNKLTVNNMMFKTAGTFRIIAESAEYNYGSASFSSKEITVTNDGLNTVVITLTPLGGNVVRLTFTMNGIAEGSLGSAEPNLIRVGWGDSATLEDFGPGVTKDHTYASSGSYVVSINLYRLGVYLGFDDASITL